MSLGSYIHINLIAVAAPGADTNIPGGQVTVKRTGSRVRATCAFQNDTTFKCVLTRGATSVTLNFKEATDLTGESFYTFEIPCAVAGDVLEWQIGTDGIVRYLSVDEYTGGAS